MAVSINWGSFKGSLELTNSKALVGGGAGMRLDLHIGVLIIKAPAFLGLFCNHRAFMLSTLWKPPIGLKQDQCHVEVCLGYMML